MKRQFFPTFLAAVIGLAAFSTTRGFAQTSSVENPGSQPAPSLSYGAANVLKLAQAHVGDEAILAYVQKSGLDYGNLNATQIIYLHEQGVSDHVVTSMLEEGKKSRDEANAKSAAQQNVAANQVAAQAPAVTTTPQYVQTYVAPPVTYVQPAPSVIYMHDSSPRLIDYGIYPRFGFSCYPGYGYRSYGYGYRNYGYHYPRASFSIGFGGHYGGFSFHGGGFHGGFHH